MEVADSKTGPGCGKVCVCAGAPTAAHHLPGAMDTLALGFWGPEALLPVFAEESPSEAAPGGQALGREGSWNQPQRLPSANPQSCVLISQVLKSFTAPHTQKVLLKAAPNQKYWRQRCAGRRELLR